MNIFDPEISTMTSEKLGVPKNLFVKKNPSMNTAALLNSSVDKFFFLRLNHGE